MSMWENMFSAGPQQQMQRMMMQRQLGGLGAGLMQAGQPVPFGQTRGGMFGQAMQQAMPDPRMQMMMMQQQQQMAQAEQKKKLNQQIAASMGGAGQIQAAGGSGLQDALQTSIAGGNYDAARLIQGQMKQGQGQKPPTGMRLNAVGQWEYDPNYLKGQVQLKRAGKAETNIYNAPEAKLYSDYEKALKEGDTGRANTLERIIKKKAQPSGEAARAQEMVETGSAGMQTIIDELMPGGEVDRKAVRSAYMGLPFSEGRGTESRLLEATGLMLRMETGAAQTAEEVENIMKRYAPNPLDTDKTIKDKLTRLKDRFDRAVKIHTGKTTEQDGQNDPLGLR